MPDPIEVLKTYDRFRYEKDAEGHKHDPASGQFVSMDGGEGKKKFKKIQKEYHNLVHEQGWSHNAAISQLATKISNHMKMTGKSYSEITESLKGE
jgi:hypothetical protein